jgi:hypothetical protein
MILHKLIYKRAHGTGKAVESEITDMRSMQGKIREHAMYRRHDTH